MRTVNLIGAPTDVGASVRGSGMGPDALRVAGLVEALHAHRLAVLDRGNLAGPPTPWSEPQAGLRHLPEVVAWNRLVFDAVDGALAAGHTPLTVGTSHACRGASTFSVTLWRSE